MWCCKCRVLTSVLLAKNIVTFALSNDDCYEDDGSCDHQQFFVFGNELNNGCNCYHGVGVCDGDGICNGDVDVDVVSVVL